MSGVDDTIAAWVRQAAAADGCGGRARADELEDHVRTAVDELVARGHDEEAALAAVFARLGSPEALAGEFRRGRGLAAWLWIPDSETEEAPMNDQKRLRVRVAVLVLVQSVAWAVVMQVTAAALSGTGRFEQISPWLLAAWFVMTMMPLTLLDLRASARAEWQCLRRAVRAIRG